MIDDSTYTISKEDFWKVMQLGPPSHDDVRDIVLEKYKICRSQEHFEKLMLDELKPFYTHITIYYNSHLEDTTILLRSSGENGYYDRCVMSMSYMTTLENSYFGIAPHNMHPNPFPSKAKIIASNDTLSGAMMLGCAALATAMVAIFVF